MTIGFHSIIWRAWPPVRADGGDRLVHAQAAPPGPSERDPDRRTKRPAPLEAEIRSAEPTHTGTITRPWRPARFRARYSPRPALVAQGIERRIPNPCAQVRILPGALAVTGPGDCEGLGFSRGTAWRPRTTRWRTGRAIRCRCVRPRRESAPSTHPVGASRGHRGQDFPERRADL